jgi:hypothetical protein
MLAEDAVSCEPVSEHQFPTNWEINREFRRIRPYITVFASDQAAESITYGRIPYATEQGIFKRVTGNSGLHPRG